MHSIESDSLNWFQIARLGLIDTVKQLATHSRERKHTHLVQKAEHLQKKLEGFYFNLVLLGEFKRGKSTLVNALIGAAVLPTATIPLTSVTTIVRYGDVPKMIVRFSAGNRIELELAEMEKYVTERGNPENKLQVDTVELEYPAAIFQDGVCIVDTPGTGSVHRHNTETTLKFLPEADAAIFLFAADQPASRQELDFLQESRKFVKRFFFVQNKIDYLDEQGKTESLEFLQRTLNNELAEECVIYPLSGRQALEAKRSGDAANFAASGLKNLEDDLITFLSKERATTFIQTVTSRVIALTIEIEQLIKLEQQVTSAPLSTLEDCLLKFQQASAEILSQQSDADYIVKGEVSHLVKRLEDDLKPVVEANKNALVEFIVQTFEQNKKFDNDQLIEILKSNLKNRIQDIFIEWRLSEDKKIESSFEKITRRFVDRANEMIDEIKALTISLFEIEITAHFEVEPLTDKSRHYYAVNDPFTLSMQLIPLMMPNPIAKSIIRERFVEAAPSELSRNAGRLRADYQERIEASSRKFLTNFHSQIKSSLQQIESVVESAIEKRKQSAQDFETSEKQLTEELSKIKNLRGSLDRTTEL